MAWAEPHHGRVLTSLLELQQDQAFTDLTVRLEDGEVRACRLTVACLSRPWRCMLTTDMRERSEGVLTLDLVSRAEWRCILGFYLSGDKLVTADNVEDVLTIAHLYELEALAEHCGRVLMDTLTLDNYWDRFWLSEVHLPSVREAMLEFLRENFVTLRQNRHFLALSRADVLDLLLRKPGVVTTEEMLCDAILKWLDANAAGADASLEMVRLLRLRELSREYVCKTLLTHKQVLENASAKKHVEVEMKRLEGRKKRKDYSTPKKRYPYMGIGDDVVIFGSTGREFRSFCCKKGSDAWRELPSPEGCSECYAVHKLDAVIFITGGGISPRATHKLDLLSLTWSRGPDLQEGRLFHGMTSVEDSVFVVAGFNDGGTLSSVETLDPDSESWEKVGDLQVAVSSAGVAAVDDVIFVVGDFETPDIIQTFNVTTRAAALLEAHLTCPMKTVSAASLPTCAVFVEEGGEVVRVSLTQSGVAVTCGVRLAGFGRRFCFGLALEDEHLLCLGGGSHGALVGSKVERYSLRGARESNERVPELPLALRVHGAFFVWI